MVYSHATMACEVHTLYKGLAACRMTLLEPPTKPSAMHASFAAASSYAAPPRHPANKCAQYVTVSRHAHKGRKCSTSLKHHDLGSEVVYLPECAATTQAKICVEATKRQSVTLEKRSQ